MPPFAEIEHFVQTQLFVEKLAFVDQKPGVDLAFLNGVDDLVERDDDVFEIRIVNSQCEKRARQLARNRDLHIADLVGASRLFRDDDRAVFVADARTVRQQSVFVGDIRVGVKRDRGHVEDAVFRVFVERSECP